MEEPQLTPSAETKPTVAPTSAPAPQPAPAPTPAAAPLAGADGLNGPLPAELHRWSWAAFLMNWVWGIAHNVWIALLMFIPFVNFFMVIYLGIKGNELAWKNRKFESVEQFKQVQKMWTYWGIGITGIGLLFTFLMWSFIIGAMLGGLSSGSDYDLNTGTDYQNEVYDDSLNGSVNDYGN